MGIGVEKLFYTDLNSEMEELNREKLNIENYMKRVVTAKKIFFIGIITLFYLALTIYTTGFFLLCLPLYLFKIRDIWLKYEDRKSKRMKEKHDKRITKYRYIAMGMVLKDIDPSLQCSFDKNDEIGKILTSELALKSEYKIGSNVIISGKIENKNIYIGNFEIEHKNITVPAMLRGVILKAELKSNLDEKVEIVLSDKKLNIEDYFLLKAAPIREKDKEIYNFNEILQNDEKELIRKILTIREKFDEKIYIILNNSSLNIIIFSDDIEIATSHEKLLKLEWLSKNYSLISSVVDYFKTVLK